MYHSNLHVRKNRTIAQSKYIGDIVKMLACVSLIASKEILQNMMNEFMYH